MKKIFILATILAVLAGCSQNETVKVPESSYISFSDAFIENATRADNTITTLSINSFDVWAHNTSNVIMRKVNVTKQADGTWSYNDKKEWEEGESYYFHAFAPTGIINAINPYSVSTAERGLPVLTFTNDGRRDFIYATADREQPLSIDNPLDLSKVSLQFHHLLSKVKFSFRNNVSSNISIKVTDIKIKEAGRSAKIDLNGADNTWIWQDAYETADFLFGDTENILKGETKDAGDILFMLPATSKEYEITFNIHYGAEHPAFKTTKVTVEFKRGFAYNFIAVIDDSDIEPFSPTIEFEVGEVIGWTEKDVVVE